MRYALMHKDVEVADLDISPESGSVDRILLVRQPEHMPVGTCIKGHVDGTRLKQWWKNRSIPASRSGIGHLLESLGIDDTLLLLTNSMGLSLSDHYWIKKADCNVTWFDVNFFDDDFSEDIGNLLFGNTVDAGSIDLSSPDNTSDGILRKKWKIIDGRRFLLKGGEPPSMQEPYNEVMASVLMDALGIPHVDYRLIETGGMVYCACEDFVDKGTEFVSADAVIHTGKRRNDIGLYDHYVRCCSDLGVDAVPSLDMMMVIDYILANGDRHTGNFGLICSPDTLEFLGPSPIFDSGSSLGHRSFSRMLRSGVPQSCKPFAKTFDKQIRLVTSFDWIDFGALDDAIGRCAEIVDGIWDVSDPGRSDAIIGLLEDRAYSLKAIAERR